jgi:hypothetical protein
MHMSVVQSIHKVKEHIISSAFYTGSSSLLETLKFLCFSLQYARF